MHCIVREIQFSKWSKHPDVKWLSPGELQADALRDIKTSASALSVYSISDQISFKRIVAALAAKKDRLRQFHYVDFEDGFLNEKGFVFRSSPEHGTTFDIGVNQVHYDIIDLTPQSLYELALCIFERVSFARLELGVEIVASYINESIDMCYINPLCLKPKLLKKLRDYRQ